jgi:D-alanine-D-alanine ligase
VVPKKVRVAVIFGGRSGEHEVSIRSAGSVIQAIDRKKFDVLPIAITKEGKWLPPQDSVGLLPAASQASISPPESTGNVALLGDPSHKGLISIDNGASPNADQPIDVIFPVLHGPLGEDGTLQGLLEMADIPYVGCGVLASAAGMDKVTMKALFVEAGLPICKHLWFLRSQWRDNPAKVRRKIIKDIGLPCFVKPANLGSSVGVSRAVDSKSLTKAIDLAAEYDRKIIVEEEIVAREIECAILGNDEPKASLPGEYVILDEAARFLDYTEKYSSTGKVRFVVPAPLSKTMTERIQRMAIRAFRSIDGAGLARVDFFVTRDDGRLLINEVNTLPGLTEVSGWPQMWEGSGVKFSKVLEELIELAFERHRDKALTKTSR